MLGEFAQQMLSQYLKSCHCSHTSTTFTIN